MAAAALPRPGTKYGPCQNRCQHIDCVATRRMAESNCSSCAEPIGYERRFYREELPGGSDDLIHAACAEEG